jgi:hypothetical protein
MPRRHHGAPRHLTLKFRFRVLRRIPLSEAFRQIRHAIKTGIAPDDIELSYMDYARKQGRRFRSGDRLTPDEAAELERFYNVLASVGPGSVRVERPDV